MIYAHIIRKTDGKMITKVRMNHAPRVGDEIRVRDDLYMRVEQVVWCLDEEHGNCDRVNIGVINA